MIRLFDVIDRNPDAWALAVGVIGFLSLFI